MLHNYKIIYYKKLVYLLVERNIVFIDSGISDKFGETGF